MIKYSLFLFILFIISACGSADYECTDPQGCHLVSSGQPITIAVLAALHAEQAPDGIALLASVQEAVDTYGAINDHDIALTWEGTDCTEESARLAASLLAQVDGLVAVIGPSCLKDIPFSVPTLEDAGIVVVFPSSGGEIAFTQLMTAIKSSGITLEDGSLIIPRSALIDALKNQP